MTENIIVLATGGKTGGGSGFENLVEYFNGPRSTHVKARVVGVVSNIQGGGVEERAHRLKVPFRYIPNSALTKEVCQGIPSLFGLTMSTSWIAMSGFLRFVIGLDPARSFNIHPALIRQLGGRFAGPGKHGHHVHELVAQALENGELGENPHSGFTMHFVVDGGGDPLKGYDKGPIFCEVSVPLRKNMTADEIGKAVNQAEHTWQPYVTELVVTGQIYLEGGRVFFPPAYKLMLA